MDEDRKLIIPKGVLEPGSNVVEIPAGCEDSLALIAKLQAKYGRPPGYYPPQTNPNNKFERRIGDAVVGLGLPPLSPLREEPHRYQSSFSEYGSYYRSPETPQRRPRRVASPVKGARPPPRYPPNVRRQLFSSSGAADCSCSSEDISDLVDSSGVSQYSQSPLARPLSSSQSYSPRPGPSYAPPRTQISAARRLVSPDSRAPVRAPTPSGGTVPLPSPPRGRSSTQPSPCSDLSYSMDNISELVSPPARSPPRDQRRPPSPAPLRVSPRTHLTSQMRQPSPHSDLSYSMDNISDLISPSASPPRGHMTSQRRPPSPSPVRVPSPRTRITTQMRQPSPQSDSSYSMGNISELVSPPPRDHISPQMRQPSPNVAWDYSMENIRAPSPVVSAHRSENRRDPSCNWEYSCSVGDISGLVSPEPGPSRPPVRLPFRAESTPQKVQPRREISFSMAEVSDILDRSYAVSEEISNNALNESMRALEQVERHESSRVQQSMRSFQSARRELVASIFTLHDVDVGGSLTKTNC